MDREVRHSGSNQRAVDLLMSHMDIASRSAGTRALPASQLHEPNRRAAQFVLNYLDAFGYFPKPLAGWSRISTTDIVTALQTFQKFFGISKSGQVSMATVRAMEAPRCGCPDLPRDHQENFVRARNFIRAGLPRWRKKGLTYEIRDYLPGVDKSEFEKILASAFSAWTSLGNIDVRVADDISDAPDILIATGSGAQSNFDGPGGILAWANMPTGNDEQLLIKFDLGETWVTSAQQRGIILLNVATHEFGHLFGLDHSRMASAIMAPYYNAVIAKPQADDDIPRFQKRYGVRTVPDGTLTQSKVEITGDAIVRINGITI